MNRCVLPFCATVALLLFAYPSAATSPIKGAYQFGPGLFLDNLPGTDVEVGYGLGPDKARLELGDRIRLHIVLYRDGIVSAPCDTFDFSARVGSEDLPPALEWALAVDSHWGDWSVPIWAGSELLDARFTKCGADTVGWYRFSMTIVDVDSTRRSGLSSEEKSLRTAIHAYRDDKYADAAAAIDPLVRKHPDRILFRAILAGGYCWSMQCREYAEQVAEFERRGLAAKESRTWAEAGCRYWNGLTKERPWRKH